MWCGDHTVNPSTKYAAEFATGRLTPPGSVRGGVWMWCDDHTVNPSTKCAAEFARTRRLTQPGVQGWGLDVVRRPHRKPLPRLDQLRQFTRCDADATEEKAGGGGEGCRLIVDKRAHTFITNMSNISILTSTFSLVGIVPRRAVSFVCAWWRGKG